MSAPLLTFVSASGGAGKSTLALSCAWLAASSGISTALVEADLQFGDMGYWLGLDAELPSLAAGQGCDPIHLAPNLCLYKAPPLPEVAEEVSDDVAGLVTGIRRAYSLVIADTGQFWSGLTADLVLQSSLVFNVMDARPASIMGALRVRELCSRIGVPTSRCVDVYNRYSGKARLSDKEAAAALSSQGLHTVADGRSIVDMLVCSGGIEELLTSGNVFVRDADRLLCALLPRVGLAYAATKASAKRGGLFR